MLEPALQARLHQSSPAPLNGNGETEDCPSPESSNGKKFVRPPTIRKACDLCHQAKQKCSQDKPSCERCRQSGWQCNYTERQRRRTAGQLVPGSQKYKLQLYQDTLSAGDVDGDGSGRDRENEMDELEGDDRGIAGQLNGQPVGKAEEPRRGPAGIAKMNFLTKKITSDGPFGLGDDGVPTTPPLTGPSRLGRPTVTLKDTGMRPNGEKRAYKKRKGRNGQALDADASYIDEESSRAHKGGQAARIGPAQIKGIGAVIVQHAPAKRENIGEGGNGFVRRDKQGNEQLMSTLEYLESIARDGHLVALCLERYLTQLKISTEGVPESLLADPTSGSSGSGSPASSVHEEGEKKAVAAKGLTNKHHALSDMDDDDDDSPFVAEDIPDISLDPAPLESPTTLGFPAEESADMRLFARSSSMPPASLPPLEMSAFLAAQASQSQHQMHPTLSPRSHHLTESLDLAAHPRTPVNAGFGHSGAVPGFTFKPNPLNINMPPPPLPSPYPEEPPSPESYAVASQVEPTPFSSPPMQPISTFASGIGAPHPHHNRSLSHSHAFRSDAIRPFGTGTQEEPTLNRFGDWQSMSFPAPNSGNLRAQHFPSLQRAHSVPHSPFLGHPQVLPPEGAAAAFPPGMHMPHFGHFGHGHIQPPPLSAALLVPPPHSQAIASPTSVDDAMIGMTDVLRSELADTVVEVEVANLVNNDMEVDENGVRQVRVVSPRPGSSGRDPVLAGCAEMSDETSLTAISNKIAGKKGKAPAKEKVAKDKLFCRHNADISHTLFAMLGFDIKVARLTEVFPHITRALELLGVVSGCAKCLVNPQSTIAQLALVSHTCHLLLQPHPLTPSPLPLTIAGGTMTMTGLAPEIQVHIVDVVWATWRSTSIQKILRTMEKWALAKDSAGEVRRAKQKKANESMNIDEMLEDALEDTVPPPGPFSKSHNVSALRSTVSDVVPKKEEVCEEERPREISEDMEPIEVKARLFLAAMNRLEHIMRSA